jgi:hypothetical protein
MSKHQGRSFWLYREASEPAIDRGGGLQGGDALSYWHVTVNRFTEFPGHPCSDPCVKKT